MIKTSQQYDAATRQSTGIAVVRCTADWCQPCKVIAPKYAELDMPGVRFYTMDVDVVDDFQDVNSARKLPCFFIFKDGTPKGLVAGANLTALTDEIKKLQ